MNSYQLHRTTIIPGDLLSVFSFFKNPRNLEAITPPWLGFRIVSTSDDAVREGTRIRYHQHTFRRVPDGVEMTDVVDYALPFGLLGRAVHWEELFV